MMAENLAIRSGAQSIPSVGCSASTDLSPRPELDSVAWEGVQQVVRSFRQALRTGERPAIEAYAPERISHRKTVLVELMHEEMEFQFKAGEPSGLASYLERFPELADDPRNLIDLVATESDLRQETTRTREKSAEPEKTGVAARPPARIGRYELGDVIGQGAFGVVHRAWDTTLHRAVALKRPRHGTLESEEAVERFLREARSVAGLRHPHIVPVFDAGQLDGEPFLVSALVEGRNLADELTVARPRVRQAVEWIASLADALEHAHRLGVVHRDVKPSNALIDREDRVYLTDFGLAKSAAGDASLTFEGQVIGTPAYMAPEQSRGEKAKLDARTDVYSLGVILYELMTGTRPFTGAGRLLTVQIEEEEPRPPRRLDSTIPADLETVCLKAMAKVPGHRYASASGLADDLRRWLRGEPVLARPVGPTGMFWRKCRRKPLLSGLAASLALAVAIGFLGVTREWWRAEAFRRRAETNLAEVQSQRERANQALLQATRTLTRLRVVSEKGELGFLGPRAGRVQLQSLLTELYQGLSTQSRDDPIIRRELALAAAQIATLLEENASGQEALSAWLEARELYEIIAKDEPTNTHVQFWFANCFMRQGFVLHRMGRKEEGDGLLIKAEEQWRRVVAIAEARRDQHPDDLGLWMFLADCNLHVGFTESELGRIPEALAAFQHACDIAEANLHRTTGGAAENLTASFLVASRSMAVALQDQRPVEAIAILHHASALMDGQNEDNLPGVGTQAELARNLFWTAVIEDRIDRTADAVRDFQRAAELFEGVGRANALLASDRGALATSYHCIGRLRVDNGRPGEALESFRKAIALREASHRSDSANVTHRDDCAGSWHRLGVAMEDLGRLDEAAAAYQKGLAYRRPLVNPATGNVRFRKGLDEQLRDLDRLWMKMGRSAQALEIARERKALWPDDPTVALGVAGELATAAVRVRDGETILTTILSKERRQYAIGALATARDAMRLMARKAHLAQTHH